MDLQFCHVFELSVDLPLFRVVEAEIGGQTRQGAFDKKDAEPVTADELKLFGEGDFQEGAFSDQIVDRLV